MAVAGFFLRLGQPGLAGAQRRFVAEGAAIGADLPGAFGAADERRAHRLAVQPGHEEPGDEAVAGPQRVDDIGRDETACRGLARLVASYGPSQVVITRGAEGALAFDGSEFLSQGIVEATVVDTLGAGDGFIAGFLMARLQGQPIRTALSRGAECAGQVCSYRGAFGHEAPLRPGQPGLIKPQEEAGNGHARLANREEEP